MTARSQIEVVPPLTELMINSRLCQFNWVSLWSDASTLPSFQAPRAMFHAIGRNVRAGAQPKLLFLNPSFQPHTPNGGGRLGFIVFGCSLSSMRFGGLHRVVVKRRIGRWSYYGDYRFLPVRALSASEWNELCVQDRRKWAEFLLSSGYKAMHMRVAFSKSTGREAGGIDLALNRARLAGSVVTVEDALQVWSLGLALPTLVGLECVRVDEDFVRQIRSYREEGQLPLG